MDRTELENLEIAILDKSQLSNIFHQLSHDIGNPLTSIITYGSLIEQCGDLNIPPEKIATYAKSMLSETWKISTMVEKFLLLVSEKSNSSGCNLKNIATKIMSRYQSRYGLTPFDLELIGFDQDFLIQGDPEQLTCILCELLSNSAHALKELSQTNPDIDLSLKLESILNENQTVSLSISNLTIKHETDLIELLKPGVSETRNGRGSIGIGLTAVNNTVIKWGGDFIISEIQDRDNYLFKAIITLPTVS